MRKKNASMIATAIAFALALPAGALAQDNSGNGPAVVSPLQLPGTAGAPQAQVPQPQSDSGVNWKGVGVGAGTAVGNVLYVPAKVGLRHSRQRRRWRGMGGDRRQYPGRQYHLAQFSRR